MEKQKFSYYQYRPDFGYPVFIRTENEQLTIALGPVLDQLGFKKLEEEQLKVTVFDQRHTKILKVSTAGPRLAKQILSFSGGLDAFGPESLAERGEYQLYRYQGVGVMIFSEDSPQWELGLLRPEQNAGPIQAMLVRFLAWALAARGVLGFWGVPVSEGIVVMKPGEAQFESVFIDMDRMTLFTREGTQSIDSGLTILRLDETLREQRQMSKEALLSFLSANTAYFSYHGNTPAMQRRLYELAEQAFGVIYPWQSFQTRASDREAS